MAGTDSTQPMAAGPAPVVVLVRPQMGENIGAAARAMKNFGLADMRLVAPRDGWPNDKAVAMSSRADDILTAATLFDDTEAAVADLHALYATTARRRDMVKPELTPRQAAAEMRARIAAGERVGVLFGAEKAGLDNDDVTLARAIIQVPTNPAFGSINLAQAVLLLGYEWSRRRTMRPRPRRMAALPPARPNGRSSFPAWRRSWTGRASSSRRRSAPTWSATSATSLPAPI